MDIKNIKKGRLILGDCKDVIKGIPSNSIDQIITDPPYGLSYYGLDWDKKVPSIEVWKECLRVLKPGAFILVMSSTRQDLLGKMVANLTDAGFNTRFTSLYWTYMNGFPKAHNTVAAINKKLDNQSKAIEINLRQHANNMKKSLKNAYAGFQPKPAVEAILIAMKPLSEKSYVDQALSNHKGVTYLGDCRIPSIGHDQQLQTRFMSNLIVSDNALDLNQGKSSMNIECISNSGNSFRFSLDAWAKYTLPHLMVTKPSKKERDLGLDGLPEQKSVSRDPGQWRFNVPMKHRPTLRKNNHPNVKPLKLMAYQIALGSCQGDIVLDPFCGSGTTCVAAMLMGRKFIGIEKDVEFYNIAKTRLKNITGQLKKEDSPIPFVIKNLSEIESITLNWCDDTVIDMKPVPLLIDHVLNNSQEEQTIFDKFKAITTFKPEVNPPTIATVDQQPVKSKKEKDNVQDWADKGINVYRGCSNDCRYCYAREISVRQHGNTLDQWKNEVLNKNIVKKGWRKSDKFLMFPTTHDITPGTYDVCEVVLTKVLKAGNTVLIVSKPRADLIAKLCDALNPYKKQILFRFTIGAQDNELLSFWEPNAPAYEDRRKALKIAHEKGFNTSVSLEPMLDPANIEDLIEDLRAYTTDSMWIGTMTMIRKRVKNDSAQVEAEIVKIMTGQTPKKLESIYMKYKNDPLIKWKGHVRKALKKVGIEVPDQKDDWRDHIKK